MRDDFNQTTKEKLAYRVGFRCSNPDCRRPTSGPKEENDGHINIGVAAHICAASEGGPRYNVNMTSNERKSINNGIWLCQNCAKIIDNDESKYTTKLLEVWKSTAEQLTLAELKYNTSNAHIVNDIKLLKFYSECLDRPAFQDEIRQEGRMENFEKAIEDTIIALNTGVSRARDGSILKQSEGKSNIKNQEWREKLYMITDILVLIRMRLIIAKKERAYYINDDATIDATYCFYDEQLVQWFDSSRQEILNIFSSICKEANLPIHVFPRKRYRW